VRGLKFNKQKNIFNEFAVAPHVGAWIEIDNGGKTGVKGQASHLT